MKKRIQEFYADHKDEVIVVTGIAAVAAGSIALAYMKKAEGMEIVRMVVFKEDDKIINRVFLKNHRYVDAVLRPQPK